MNKNNVLRVMPTQSRTEHSDKEYTEFTKNIAFLLTPKLTIATITETDTIRQALEKMKHHNYTAIPVISHEGDYIGTVNDGDFLWYIINGGSADIKEYEHHTVQKLIRESWNPAIKIDTPLITLLDRVQKQNFVPVVDDRNKFMGIITRKSVLQYYHNVSLSILEDD